jgi:plastocyanin
MNAKMIASLSLGLIAAAASIAAQAEDSPSMAPQQVVVSSKPATEPQTKWISIGRGDTVKFTQNGQSYTLRLDQDANSKAYDLSNAGPKDAALKGLHVSVTPDAVDSN